eukprot:TRINITY_DN23138_c0_g3_i1.p1 TRINITY_DN23138_c0_g3~~TRINITY_DN23138_c0_g3_i1.p1  ORF type:complete len:280 (-),score=11.78 TRINITY_DN23138_c0_g3_i1:297-1136(-)
MCPGTAKVARYRTGKKMSHFLLKRVPAQLLFCGPQRDAMSGHTRQGCSLPLVVVACVFACSVDLRWSRAYRPSCFASYPGYQGYGLEGHRETFLLQRSEHGRHLGFGRAQLRVVSPSVSVPGEEGASTSEESQAERRGPLGALKAFKARKQLKRLSSVGAAGSLSYLLFKIIKYAIITFLAWYSISVKTSLTPLRQWPAFLSVWASLYVASSVLHPVKYAATVAFTVVIDRSIDSVSRRLATSRKRSVGVLLAAMMVFAVALHALAVLSASALSGVAFW